MANLFHLVKNKVSFILMLICWLQSRQWLTLLFS